jgi:hypothetical protein
MKQFMLHSHVSIISLLLIIEVTTE